MKLEVTDGCFGYIKNKRILNDISFTLGEGEILTVLGANGVGKTTLLKCITGILKWDSGFTMIDGQKVRSSGDLRKIGYVPQAHRLSFPYTVIEMVNMGRSRQISFFGAPSKADYQKSLAAMNEVGIAFIRDCPCSTLSGGQLQLVFIARALAGEPELLILDEPESHLDFKNQFMILELIQRLVKERKLSCVINTHYPDHALRISDYTLMLKHDRYVVGKTKAVITESNIRAYFGINAKLFTIPDIIDDIQSIVVLPF
jgi:iron complex transport system ATP-binding protein